MAQNDKQLQQILLTPGPVAIADFVLQAMQRPVIPHRTAEFEDFYGGVLENIQYLFQTEQAVGTLIGGGSATVEIMMGSLLRQGEKVLLIENGKFSERWGDHADAMALDCVRLKKEWGKSAEPDELLPLLAEHPDTTALMLTHCATSTGALLDLEEIALQCRRQYPELLILVDAISTVGAIPFYFDDWGIDCVVAASPKALMCPAGLGLFALSQRAQARLKHTHLGDASQLHSYLVFAQKNSFPFTPPLSLLYALDAALAYVCSETLPVIWNKTHRSAKVFNEGIKSLNEGMQSLKLTVFPEQSSDSLTVFFIPKNKNTKLLKYLKNKGFILAGGQGPFTEKLIRISNMGLADADMMRKIIKLIVNY